ncbi:MAG TPA: hypothetical protein VEN82_03920 [Actinomycetota bacterium]|nr:hypothetical protein [Actinomycetota bacterium]
MVGILCPECGLEYDNDVEIDEAHCPWCGARNPDQMEWLVWLELRAAEQAGRL